MRYYVGVDLGGTNTKVGVVTENGEMVCQKRVPTREPEGPLRWAERVAAIVDELIVEATIDRSSVTAVGTGTPGPLSRAKGQLFRLFNLPHFADFKICETIGRLTGFPTYLDNDANCATFAEWWVGAGRGTHDMILVTLGTGIGGGVISEGRLLHGSKDMGMEIGHVTIDPFGRRCNCGNIGCIETFAAAPAVARRAREALMRGEKSSLPPDGEITCLAVQEAAAAGDTLAKRIIAETGFYLGAYLVGMINIFDPEMVVFTGGMIGLGNKLLKPIKRVLKDRLFPEIQQNLTVRFTTLEDNAGIIGAAGCAKIEYETSQS